MPNWVDLTTSDRDGAREFYHGLFGWTFRDRPVQDGYVYTVARLGEDDVAGITPQPQQAPADAGPASWNCYFAVTSLDDAAGQVGQAGGVVAVAATSAGEAGRGCLVIDPAGAAVMLWEAGEHAGATLTGEPGTVAWTELLDASPAALRFYQDVFGLTSTVTGSAEGEYVLLHLAGREVAGMTMAGDDAGPSRWHVHFAVASTDAAAARARDLGGTILTPPREVTFGRNAVIRDPQGAVFSIGHAASG
jgi:predicted enzyme related to lactoylglutathione lyase